MKFLRVLGVSCVAALMSFQAHAVVLSGTIDVFGDSTFSFPVLSYSDGATLFSQIGVSGTLQAGETSATIDTISFAEITLTGAGPVVLLTGGAFSGAGVARNLAVTNFGGPSAPLAGPVNADFNHDVNTTLDLQGLFTLEATVDVAMTISLSGGGTSSVVQQLTLTSGSFALEGDASPVPAPGALLFFGIGAVFAGAARRKARA